LQPISLHRQLAAQFAILALDECASVATGPGQMPYVPYSQYSKGNIHDRGGGAGGGGGVDDVAATLIWVTNELPFCVAVTGDPEPPKGVPFVTIVEELEDLRL
jgi:hypothetical protein